MRIVSTLFGAADERVLALSAKHSVISVTSLRDKPSTYLISGMACLGILDVGSIKKILLAANVAN